MAGNVLGVLAVFQLFQDFVTFSILSKFSWFHKSMCKSRPRYKERVLPLLESISFTGKKYLGPSYLPNAPHPRRGTCTRSLRVGFLCHGWNNSLTRAVFFFLDAQAVARASRRAEVAAIPPLI